MALALVLSTLVPATAGAGHAPLLHSPLPAPGSLVTAGATELLLVWARTDAEVDRASITVDGLPVTDTTVGQPVPGRGQPITASAQLAPGRHVVRVEAQDTAGGRSERAWSVTATDVTAHRLAGKDRWHTALAISRATYPEPGTARAAVLARADDFADALAGAPLAASTDGPLLLSTSDHLPRAVADELQRALPQGATVHLLGGPSALSDAVEQEVAALGYDVVRHHGADRYGTAAAIAARLPAHPSAFLTSGTTFPDALAVSVPAARDGIPVLLTHPDHLPTATRDALVGRGVDRVTIAGGAAAVGSAVADEVDQHVRSVDRVSGPDRYATAAAVLERYFDNPASVALASGVSFPDALAGTRYAAAHLQPLLLTDPAAIPTATATALRGHRPGGLTVFGGSAAVHPSTVSTARAHAHTGADVATLVTAAPLHGSVVPYLDDLRLRFDRDLEASSASVHLEIGGREEAVLVTADEDRRGLRVQLSHRPEAADDLAHDSRAVIEVVDTAGRTLHTEVPFTYRRPNPVYAYAGPVALHLPSRDVELVGFHQSNHDGARLQSPQETATFKLTMESRGRGTDLHSAADIVANPDEPVLSPVSGTVLRAGSYRLYCDHTDHYLVIEPDERPGWEVKLLHFTGLSVARGQRVVAGVSVVGAGPRTLPFESQVDEYSAPRNWPHLHLEVVDPSIPDRSSGGGC